jgi:hypothetical protein
MQDGTLVMQPSAATEGLGLDRSGEDGWMDGLLDEVVNCMLCLGMW